LKNEPRGGKRRKSVRRNNKQARRKRLLEIEEEQYSNKDILREQFLFKPFFMNTILT
jgi:hypothetical protein